MCAVSSIELLLTLIGHKAVFIIAMAIAIATAIRGPIPDTVVSSGCFYAFYSSGRKTT